jgi:ubiquitin carboxyl-terminal hydrolase 8
MSMCKDGISGLVNIGNTCYVNAFIHIMNYTPLICDIMTKKRNNNHIRNNTPESIVVFEWLNLKDIMFNKSGTVSPNRFIHKLHQSAIIKNRELFSGWMQNDMVEFVHFFIECMHESILRKVDINISGICENSTDILAVECYKMLKNTYTKEYSEIMNMYYGIYVSTIETYNSKNPILESMKPEMYMTLDLPIPENATNIMDCIDEFCRPEILEGDNAWFNDKTGKYETAVKQIVFWDFPPILIITFKRFSPCGTYKNNANISCPVNEFDLSSHVVGYKSNIYKYTLFGVCNHMGTVSYGHYTSSVKTHDNTWINFDDESVNIIECTEDIITPYAYCVFYRREIITIL